MTSSDHKIEIHDENGASSMYEMIFKTTAAAIAITDHRGYVVNSNRALQDMLGYPPGALSGMHWSRFTYDEDVPSIRALRQDLFRGERKDIKRQIRYKRRDGEIFWVKFFGSCMAIGKSGERFIVGMAMSMTEEESREYRYRSMFETTNIGMALVDMNEITLESNHALRDMLGYSQEDLRTTTWSEVTHPDDLEQERTLLKRFHEGTIENVIFEKRLFRKDGSVLCGQVACALLRDPVGTPQYIISTLEDITEQKKAEEELLYYQGQIRSLASELTLAEEKERRRIAMYLHDHVAQNLSFCKMELEVVSESLASQGIMEDLSHVIRLIEDGVQDIRCAIMELSPPVLYELGLEKALEWLADKMLERYELEVRVEIDDDPKPVNNELRGILFRAVNELLINVVKHAQSEFAHLQVHRVSDIIRIVIMDRGVGFNPSEIRYDKTTTSGFGLFNIKERMNYLGGNCIIESSPGRGTRITLEGPISVSSG